MTAILYSHFKRLNKYQSKFSFILHKLMNSNLREIWSVGYKRDQDAVPNLLWVPDVKRSLDSFLNLHVFGEEERTVV